MVEPFGAKVAEKLFRAQVGLNASTDQEDTE